MTPINPHIQRAAEAQRQAAGHPTYAELASLVHRLNAWGSTTGGWESPIWSELRDAAERLEDRAEQPPEKAQQ